MAHLSFFTRCLSLTYRRCPGTRRMSSRTYQDAVTSLNSLQSNSATLDAVRASGGRLSQFAIPEMVEYLERIGYKTEDLNALNVIHITGTKGKGSTSAFTDSILRHTKPEWKIGLYTSPHLVAVRERIRINGRPLSETEFTKFFFEVWDRLQQSSTKVETTPFMPGYFRFVTLMAFHTFLELGVDATILEVGVGGTYDSTNIVPKPIVTGITALGIDHVGVLGKTLKEIAWQKGGIYKEGVPALSVEQPEEGMQVLIERAKELKASDFTVTSNLPEIGSIKLGLAGSHQVGNAVLAVHLARSFLRQSDPQYQNIKTLPPSFVDGLQNTKWPGRCQTVIDPAHPKLTWYLDGAHTVESLDCCIQWFVHPGVGLPSDSATRSFKRILIFNTGGGRAGPSFLDAVSKQITTQLDRNQSSEDLVSFFDQVIFCTNVTYADGGFKGDLTAVSLPPDDLAQLKTQHQLADAWSALIPSFSKEGIHVLPSIEHAIRMVQNSAEEASAVKVLVAGSLHLVGGVIEVTNLADVAL